VNVTEVLAVMVPDTPGGLAQVLDMLNDADINVEYLYSFIHRSQDKALILFKVNKVREAAECMAANNIQMLTAEQVSAL